MPADDFFPDDNLLASPAVTASLQLIRHCRKKKQSDDPSRAMARRGDAEDIGEISILDILSNELMGLFNLKNRVEVKAEGLSIFVTFTPDLIENERGEGHFWPSSIVMQRVVEGMLPIEGFKVLIKQLPWENPAPADDFDM